jgi:hypothetical protein
VPTAFTFSTNAPDGRAATISEPSNAHNGQVEFESADDFVLSSETMIRHASFTGLLTGGATLRDVSNVVVEIYRVFPLDSDVGRTSGPPTFSTSQVPTRVNSPSDVAFASRDSASRELNFHTAVLSGSFTAQASVSSADKISVHSGGNGPVTGEEVQFDVTFRNHPLDLPAGHYFFVPQVGLSDTAPAGSDFLWLSAPRPIVPPGTPFPAGFTDLQSWMRDDPPLAPDWLRVGTDVIGGATFNASFSLAGEVVKHEPAGHAADSAARGSPALGHPAGGAPTSQAALFDSQVLVALANAGAPPAAGPAAGTARGPSNAQALLHTEDVPAVAGAPPRSGALPDAALSGKSSGGQGIRATAPGSEGLDRDALLFSTFG